ncbi:MAG TPA: hypothetical protein VK427_02995, partial [Kofleriaceae bacterium]|nr:hypothetical protein [Kofleriaceae bacterium]
RKKQAPAKKPAKGKKAAPAPAPVPAGPLSYELTATLAGPAANTEREPDEDRGTANDLIIGDTVHGFVGWTGDVDLWKLSVETLSVKNTLDIQVAPVEGVALSLEVSDGVGRSLLVRKAPRGSALLVRGVLPVVASGSPPFHYLSIKGDKSNPETAYALSVAARPLETDQEVEPNDTPDKAMAFPDVKTITGNWTAGDTDCFAIAADVAARTIDVELDPQELDLALELVVDSKAAGKSETAGKGTREKVAAQVPASASAVACVRAAASAAGEGAYTLTVSEGAVRHGADQGAASP